MNEKPNIDLEKNNHKAALEYNCQMKTDGNNLIVVYNSESNAFGAMSLGQVRFLLQQPIRKFLSLIIVIDKFQQMFRW